MAGQTIRISSRSGGAFDCWLSLPAGDGKVPAILGPKRLGYDAGIACHGTQMLDFVGEMDGVAAPVCLVWGDQDFAAPPPVLEAYRELAGRTQNLGLHVFPGVLHGFMFPGNPKAFSASTRAFAIERALAILAGLRDGALRQAS